MSVHRGCMRRVYYKRLCAPESGGKRSLRRTDGVLHDLSRTLLQEKVFNPAGVLFSFSWYSFFCGRFRCGNLLIVVYGEGEHWKCLHIDFSFMVEFCSLLCMMKRSMGDACRFFRGLSGRATWRAVSLVWMEVGARNRGWAS